MNATLCRPSRLVARAFAAFAPALALASCGGGSVGPSPVVPDQQAIVILPASSATAPVLAYSGMPTTFSITGGNGSYIVASNNQAVIASPGAFTGISFTIVPSPVLAETTVTLSVRDTATAPPVTATIAVRPGTINNSITIAPSSTQAADCSPAICSGGDAAAAPKPATPASNNDMKPFLVVDLPDAPAKEGTKDAAPTPAPVPIPEPSK